MRRCPACRSTNVRWASPREGATWSTHEHLCRDCGMAWSGKESRMGAYFEDLIWWNAFPPLVILAAGLLVFAAYAVWQWLVQLGTPGFILLLAGLGVGVYFALCWCGRRLNR